MTRTDPPRLDPPDPSDLEHRPPVPAMRTMSDDITHDDDEPSLVLDAIAAHQLWPLLSDVCRRRRVLVRDLCSRIRVQSVVRARQELWWMVRNDPESDFSYGEIARIFRMDHTTVRHGVHAHAARQRG